MFAKLERGRTRGDRDAHAECHTRFTSRRPDGGLRGRKH